MRSVPTISWRIICFVATIALCSTPDLLSAQSSDIRFEHFSVEDGLPTTSVRWIVQDHEGFLWFAGNQGILTRYDGYEFVHFRHDPTDSLSLGFGAIRLLFVDSGGDLWIGMSESGLHRLNRDTHTFSHVVHDPKDPNSLSAEDVVDIREDRSGNLWLLTTTSPTRRVPIYVDRLNPKTGIVTRFLHDPEDPSTLSDGRPTWQGNGNFFMTFYEDRQGAIWIGTIGGGLNRFDLETESFEHFTHDSDNASSLSHNSVFWMHEDQSGRFWVATPGGLNLMDRESGAFTSFLHDSSLRNSDILNQARIIHEDRDGNLWVVTNGGLCRFDPDTGEFELFLHDDSDPDHPGNKIVQPFVEDMNGNFWFFMHDVQGRTINVLNHFDRSTGRLSYFLPDPNRPESIRNGTRAEAIFADRSGVIWVGAWGGGLNKFDRSSQKFQIYKQDPGNPNTLVSNNIRALHEDKSGALWIGSDGGLSRLQPATGRFTHYRNRPGDPSSLSGNRVNAILEDGSGSLWVGTARAGLNRLDVQANRFTQFHYDAADSTSLSTPVIFSLHEDESGELWVGAQGDGSETRTGLQRFDPVTNTFVHFARKPRAANDMAVYAITEDLAGGIWYGTNLGGLQHLEPTSGRSTSHKADILPFGFSIASLIRSETGDLWVGSVAGGLGRFDPESKAGEVFTTDDGLPSNTIMSLVEDATGLLWIGTSNGLARFDSASNTFTTLDRSDGLPSLAFNAGAAERGADGTLYFGTTNGLVAFRPDAVRANPYPPQIALTSFKLFDQPISPGEDSPLQTQISLAESITLSHQENDFSFGYSALHFSSPEKNRYAYKLEPYEDEWRDVGARREATYMNLAPGSYTFRVKAANNDGLWNEEGISIKVVIKPPWWRTIWAYILYGLLGVAGIAGTNRVQQRRLVRVERERASIREARLKTEAAEAHAQVLEELDQTKSRFFANISHEFRTPLTLILGPIRDMLDGIYGTVEEPIQRQHRLIQRSGDRLLRLINQLLDLSKIEAGSMTLRARRADIVPLIRRIVGSYASRAERRDIALIFTQPEDELILHFEDDKMEKIITNLLSNAFKFTPDGGRVELKALQSDSDSVELSIADSGEGIPADEVPFIFDRFRQVDSSSTRRHQGTGIGLALVKELVSLHGGTIRVESEVGVGTSFVIQFPQGTAHLEDAELIDEEEDDAIREPLPIDAEELEEQFEEILTGAPDAPLVLVVEDNPDVRQYLRDHLLTRYRVEVAEDGIEGLERARSIEPSLIISDVMMPRMDGYALCKAIKSDGKLNHIPVILLTAKADEESKVEGLETGADDYIYKPFSAAELMVRAENLIEIRRLLRERFSGEIVLRPDDLSLPSEEAEFLERIKHAVEKHMGDNNFGVDWLANEVGVSTRQLQRRLKSTIQLSPSGFIRMMRLQRAAQLLDGGIGNVSEIAYAVGFQDVKHFSTLFRQVFGASPSKYSAETA